MIGHITLSLTEQSNGLKIQASCENLSDIDVISMLETTLEEIKNNNLMEGLHSLNGGYFETIVQ